MTDCMNIWGIAIASIAVNVALIGLLWSFTSWGFSRLGGEIRVLDGEIKSIDADIKQLSSKIEADTRAQNHRTDQLYMMFIDLLKEKSIKKKSE